MEEKEFNNVYAIPANYTDSGKLFGGLLETRNTVEAVLLLLLIGYPELMWLNCSATLRIVLMTVTLLPAGILALMGINGDSLSRYVANMIRFWLRRRKLHLRRVGYRYEKTAASGKKKKRPHPPQRN